MRSWQGSVRQGWRPISAWKPIDEARRGQPLKISRILTVKLLPLTYFIRLRWVRFIEDLKPP